MSYFSFYAVVDRDAPTITVSVPVAIRRFGKLPVGQLGFDRDHSRRKLER
jgi:hypothetical protein